MLSYQAVTTVVQSAVVIAIGWGTGAAFPGGAGGIAALIGISVLLALTMAGLSDAFALLARQREAARYNPVNWAASAGRAAVTAHVPWGTVGSYAGFLALAVAVTATAATVSFRAYLKAV
jgi:ABC-2 type transport system permease protein